MPVADVRVGCLEVSGLRALADDDRVMTREQPPDEERDEREQQPGRPFVPEQSTELLQPAAGCFTPALPPVAGDHREKCRHGDVAVQPVQEAVVIQLGRGHDRAERVPAWVHGVSSIPFEKGHEERDAEDEEEYTDVPLPAVVPGLFRRQTTSEHEQRQERTP